MALKRRSAPRKGAVADRPAIDDEVRNTVAWLERHGTKAVRDGMARYAIPSDNAFGVTVGTLHTLAKRLGRSHELAGAICDTACFHLFDRTPHAWRKSELWSQRRDEFVKRAAFALLAGLAVHDKQSGDAPFAAGLALVEQAADDERNFVKKAVSWALRSVGKRSSALNLAAVDVAERLAKSPDAAARWVGKDALRELTSAAVMRRLASKNGS